MPKIGNDSPPFNEGNKEKVFQAPNTLPITRVHSTGSMFIPILEPKAAKLESETEELQATKEFPIYYYAFIKPIIHKIANLKCNAQLSIVRVTVALD